MTNPNLTDGQGPSPDESGYTPGTKSHALNAVHCLVQNIQSELDGILLLDTNFDDLDFQMIFELIESVRDKAGE